MVWMGKMVLWNVLQLSVNMNTNDETVCDIDIIYHDYVCACACALIIK